MDRFFLSALVREVAPLLTGRRARGYNAGSPSGFVIPFRGRRGQDLVVSLLPQAPGFYVGRALSPPGPGREAGRWRKLLTGARLFRIEAAHQDRVVRLDWERVTPAGERHVMVLVLEWAGTRTGAYLVDAPTQEVLDVVCPGTPRAAMGERFEPLAAPPVAELASGGQELELRLDRRRADPGGKASSAERKLLVTASGLSPLLVAEMQRIRAASEMSWGEAYDEILMRLKSSPKPTLRMPAGTSRLKHTQPPIVAPIALHPKDGWTDRSFPSFNEAAQAFVRSATELAGARDVYRTTARRLERKIRQLERLAAQLERDQASLEDPARLRHWGEVLLTGLQQAERLDGEVRLPDPYHSGAPPIRIPIEPKLDLVGNAERHFRRSKKVSRAREAIEKRRGTLRRELDYLETLQIALDDSDVGEDLQRLAVEIREAVGFEPRRPAKKARDRAGSGLSPRSFSLAADAVVLVGRSARSNEELTFRDAAPDELWFHAAGIPGAHAVLRLFGRRQAAEPEIAGAASIAAFFSKARHATSAEVVFTQRKNVRKIPGAPPGTVRLSRHRSIRVKPALPATTGKS